MTIWAMATFTLSPVKRTPALCLTISGDDRLRCGSLLAHETGFVAQERLVIVRIPVERLDAAPGDHERSMHGCGHGAAHGVLNTVPKYRDGPPFESAIAVNGSRYTEELAIQLDLRR